MVTETQNQGPRAASRRWRGRQRQARATEAEVRVVLAWEVSAPLGYAPNLEDVDWPVSPVGRSSRPPLRNPTFPCLSPLRRQRHPSNVLDEAGKNADLLGVGGRGHGRVLGMVLGSVSDHCTYHAHCPVVVVRSPALGTKDAAVR